jgi:hypothetical protein
MPILTLIAALLAGLLGGTALTAYVARDGIVFDRRSIGPWTIAPRTGSEAIDPYARARMLVSGELPLANGEGFTLIAERDSEGRPLTGRCAYRLSGAIPTARFWTLTLTTPDGRLIPNPVQRSGFTSGEIIRFAGEPLAIEVSARPLPGNWLPAPENARFLLALRLYETPLSATATVLEPRHVPALERGACLA